MSNGMQIESHCGPYDLFFEDGVLAALNSDSQSNIQVIIDARVAELYADELGDLLVRPSVLKIDATEANKSLDKFPSYVEHLVGQVVRRDHILIAIGGGIIQDITCFLSATLLRGVDWHFYPTTLLAQADSCIGSKSSINCGATKNILGTFTPPKKIFIAPKFLKTLPELDLRSGVGEILKVHAIDGPTAFDQIASDYGRLLEEMDVLIGYIHRALEIKKRYIEIDEFDKGPRNIFNYGHTFGHAMEAATKFGIPHGIAVTLGMDMANFVAARLGVCGDDHFDRMHLTLRANYKGFETYNIPVDPFLEAISKDKKNLGRDAVTLILPDQSGRIFKDVYANDAVFKRACVDYLDGARQQ